MTPMLNKDLSQDYFPPEDQPWLISSSRSIRESNRKREEIISRWLSEFPYPGSLSSKKEKLDWYNNLRNKHHEEQQARLDAFILEDPPQAYDIVKDMLSKNMPKTLSLQIKMTKSDLETLNLDGVDDATQFVANITKYGRKEYTGEKKWDSYRRWLFDVEKSNLVTIGSIVCVRDEILMDKCYEFCNKLGIERFVRNFKSEQENVTDSFTWDQYELFDKIQENMYHKLEDDFSRTNLKIGFAIVLELKCNISEKENYILEFQSKLRSRKRKSMHTADPKTYIVMSRDNSAKKVKLDKNNEDEKTAKEEKNMPPHTECFEVLWIPHEYLEYHSRITSHLLWGKGESSAVQCRLIQGDAGANSLIMKIISKELNYIKYATHERLSWKEKFCAMLALTRAATFDISWIQDNKSPEKVLEIVEDLAKFWRILLEHNDKVVGIETGEKNNDNSALGENRKALYLVLQNIEKVFRDANYHLNTEFNWRPSIAE